MSTWMVVEDEQDLYDMILTMYNLLGMKGLAFAVGADAIDWVDDVSEGLITEIPELALIDIRLPDEHIDGVHIAAKLRECDQLKHIAICLMTAFRFTPAEEKQIMAESKADLLLYKPLPRFNELKNTLQNLVDDVRKKQEVAKTESGRDTPRPQENQANESAL